MSTPSQKDDQIYQELLAHYNHLHNEMRFAKDNQIKTAYHGLLFDFAVVALLRWGTGTIPVWLQVIVTAVISGSIVLQIIYQWHHYLALKQNRIDVRYIESELLVGEWAKTIERNNHHRKYDINERQCRDLKWYTIPLCVLCLVGGLLPIYFVWAI